MMSIPRHLPVVVFCLAVAFGCSETTQTTGTPTTNTDATTDGGATDTTADVAAGDVQASDGTVAEDGKNPPAADAGGGGPDTGFSDVTGNPTGGNVKPVAAGALRTSYVSVHSWSSGNLKSGSFSAMFLDQDPSPFNAKKVMVGPCEVRSYSKKTTPGSSKLAFHHAGPLRVSGGIYNVEILPANKQYKAWTDSKQAIFLGGESLTINALGGILPAFEAKLVAPSHVTITAPTYARGNKMPIDRTQDLAVAWTGSSSGEVVFQIGGPQIPDLPSTNLVCSFPADSGKGVVPKDALAAIEGTGTGVISARVLSGAKPVAGDWGEVQVRATCDGLTPWKTNWGVSVDFQ